MRIAVYLKDIQPSVGGSFTFERTLYDALLAVAPSSRHDFIVYARSVPDEGRLPDNVRFVRAAVTRAVTSRMVSAANELQDSFLRGRAIDVPSPFDRSMRAHGVQLVWFVGSSYEECDTPFVFTPLDVQHLVQPWFPEVSRSRDWNARTALYERAVRRAVRTIVSNEAGKNEIVRHFGVGDDRVLQLPHPTPQFALEADPAAAPDVRAKYGIHKPYLFYPAQFWPHKNHVNVLYALESLREGGADLSVVFSGEDKGNLAHVRATASALGLAADVHFAGFVTQQELVGLYRDAFALTFASFFGPENLPPLEAFALGCPVICADYAGAREQLGDAALYVRPDRPEELAAAVRALIDDAGHRDELIRRGKERAHRWTAAHYVARMVEFFDEFAAVRRCWP